MLLGKYSSKNPPQFEFGDHRRGLKRFSKEHLEWLEPRIEKMKLKFGSSINELGRAVLQFLLYYNFVGTVIPGFRNLSQVKSNLFAADKPLTKEEFGFIEETFLK